MTPRIASRETGNYPPVLVAILFPAIAIGLAFPVFDPQKIKGVINSKSKKSQLPDSVVAKSHSTQNARNRDSECKGLFTSVITWDGVAMRGKALKFVSIVGGVVGAIVIALGAKTLVDTSKVPPPPKPYDVAMYDVYSALIPNIEESWLSRLIDPPPEEVLIRVETLTFQDPELDVYKASPGLLPEKRFKQAVDSATADYWKRNTSMLELQRKFNLPHYDLFTKAEQQSISKGAPACLAFQQKHPGYERWIELSVVGFNQDQTVAVVYFVETRAARPFCMGGMFEKGGHRMLQKRGGKWRLLANQLFSDWIS